MRQYCGQPYGPLRTAINTPFSLYASICYVACFSQSEALLGMLESRVLPLLSTPPLPTLPHGASALPRTCSIKPYNWLSHRAVEELESHHVQHKQHSFLFCVFFFGDPPIPQPSIWTKIYSSRASHAFVHTVALGRYARHTVAELHWPRGIRNSIYCTMLMDGFERYCSFKVNCGRIVACGLKKSFKVFNYFLRERMIMIFTLKNVWLSRNIITDKVKKLKNYVKHFN